MSTLSLRLPESIHQKLGELAEKEGISINQLINSAVAEKLSALLTEKYLAERANRGDRSAFESVLAKIPDAPAAPGDELPASLGKPGKRALANQALQQSGPQKRSSKGVSSKRRPRS